MPDKYTAAPMDDDPDRDSQKGGRPRDNQAYLAVLSATRDLATCGFRYKEITIDAIARRAMVAKTTVYRWWKSTIDLLGEACLEGRLVDPNRGSLKEDVLAIIREAVDMYETAMNPDVFAGFATDQGLQHKLQIERGEKVERKLVHVMRNTVRSAGSRGENIDHLDPVAMADHLEMFLHYKIVVRMEPIRAEDKGELYRRLLGISLH